MRKEERERGVSDEILFLLRWRLIERRRPPATKREREIVSAESTRARARIQVPASSREKGTMRKQNCVRGEIGTRRGARAGKRKRGVVFEPPPPIARTEEALIRSSRRGLSLIPRADFSFKERCRTDTDEMREGALEVSKHDVPELR